MRRPRSTLKASETDARRAGGNSQLLTPSRLLGDKSVERIHDDETNGRPATYLYRRANQGNTHGIDFIVGLCQRSCLATQSHLW